MHGAYPWKGCCSCSEITGNGGEKKKQESASKAVPTPAGTDAFPSCRPQASAWRKCQRVHIVRKYFKGSILARNRKFSKLPSTLSPATSCSSGMRTGRSFYISKNINKYFFFFFFFKSPCVLFAWTSCITWEEKQIPRSHGLVILQFIISIVYAQSLTRSDLSGTDLAQQLPVSLAWNNHPRNVKKFLSLVQQSAPSKIFLLLKIAQSCCFANAEQEVLNRDAWNSLYIKKALMGKGKRLSLTRKSWEYQ